MLSGIVSKTVYRSLRGGLKRGYSDGAVAAPVARLSEKREELRRAEEAVVKLQREIEGMRATSGKNVTVLGAGLSSTYLIEYLTKNAGENKWFVRVGDGNEAMARAKLNKSEHAVSFALDAANTEQIHEEVKRADLVISMLPVSFHRRVVEACLKNNTPLLTASYASNELMEYDAEARRKGLLLMMECGVDPGIDHMASMRMLSDLRAKGHTIRGFESFTGGLVAPESDDNPWGYKFSWNPRNVVLAGQGVSMFIQNGKLKYIPYHQLFRRYEDISIPGWGNFEGLPNRDSLKYRSIYGLEDCPTVFRGTLRRPGYCDAWDIFVQLGMTDDTYVMEDSASMTYRDFINSFLLHREHDSVELKVAYYLKKSIDSPEMKKLHWLGIFQDRKIGIPNATPARILQSLLEKKWKLGPKDLDLVVMYNKYVYEDQKSRLVEHTSAMVVKGEDPAHTAMAKTVGLPVAMVAKHMLAGRLDHLEGMQRPTMPELYNPVLDELAEHGVQFNDINVSNFNPGMFLN